MKKKEKKKLKKEEKKQKKLQAKQEKKQKKLQKKRDKELKNLHKKEEKKQKKIRKKVEKAFTEKVDNLTAYYSTGLKSEDDNRKEKIINSITKSVIINDKLLKADDRQLKSWQENHINELFVGFKALVDKYNETLSIDVIKLKDEIDRKKGVLEKLNELINNLQEKNPELVK